MTDNTENKSTRCDDVLSQSITQVHQENNDANSDLLTDTAATAAASVDTTDVEKQETYLRVIQQTQAKHSHHGHSCDMPDMCLLEATMISAKQINDGRVSGVLQQLAATKMDNSNMDSDMEKVMNSETKQDKQADTDIDSNKHVNQAEQSASVSTQSTPTTDAIQHQQLQYTAAIPTLAVSSCPPRPLVLPTLAEDSVRRHYVLPRLQATASRLIATFAVTSLSQQPSTRPAQVEDLVVAVPVLGYRTTFTTVRQQRSVIATSSVQPPVTVDDKTSSTLITAMDRCTEIIELPWKPKCKSKVSKYVF